MGHLELVKLTELMERTSGSPEVKIGLVDGPVVTQHTDLESAHLHEIPENSGATCMQANSMGCLHGTFIAGVLSAKRHSIAPAICPNCTLLIRPIFPETPLNGDSMPSATPLELALAIMECIDRGARVINLSLGLSQHSVRGVQALEDALNQAASRGVIVVAAAGNQGTIGSSVITRHPWVIPVVACNLAGRPVHESNIGGSIGRQGLMAPGDNVTSLGSQGQSYTLGGTSVAVPFVTGAIALLWSEFPATTAVQIKLVMTHAAGQRRVSVVPPLLDAEAAYQVLSTANGRRKRA